MAATTIKIQGMTCNHCVMRVAKALKAVPGVQDAKVDLQKAEAVVSFDAATVTPEKLSAVCGGDRLQGRVIAAHFDRAQLDNWLFSRYTFP